MRLGFIRFFLAVYYSLFFSDSNGLENTTVNIKFPHNASWVILSPIEQRIKEKIEKVGVPLKDWDIQINYGIKTGCNEAFIIDKAKKDELIRQSPNSVDIIRPILRGKDIKKYGYNFAELYLLFIPWHFPLHNNKDIVGASQEAEKAFQQEYPAIYNHLLQYKTQLSNRNKAETGIRYEWYALQRFGSNYMDDFNRQKIIWTDIACKPSFVFSDKEIYFLNTAYMLSGYHLHYLLHILNSKLITFYFTHTATGLGDKGLRLFKIFVEKIPIPVYVNSDIQRSLDSYKPVINLQSEQEKINKWVNQLYHLNTEEIEYINSISG